jgi:hypothetical protein
MKTVQKTSSCWPSSASWAWPPVPQPLSYTGKIEKVAIELKWSPIP